MSELKIKFSKNQVDKAGSILRSVSEGIEYDRAVEILSNWRAVHLYPINTFQATLRNKLKLIGNPNALVAQRLKRSPSIVNKLKRSSTMKLSRMQDIGGLRAVVDSVKKVQELQSNYKNTNFDHVLVREDDYILYPKSSGYRGIHLVYRYQNKTTDTFNTLQIELQIRTKLQHAWATAVETMETFTQAALKSSEGPTEWLEFFSLVGSAFALYEGTPKLEKHSKISHRKIFAQVKAAEKKLKVINKLRTFTVATEALKSQKDEQRGRKGHFHLITLNPTSRTVSIRSYGKVDLEAATEEYTRIEQEILQNRDGSQVVLVQNVSIANLRKAYPNYFLDTDEFIKKLNQVIGKNLSS